MKTSIICLLAIISFECYTAKGQSNDEWNSDNPFGTSGEPAGDSPWSDNEDFFATPTSSPPPPPVPIDGNTGFLMMAGVGYGLREIRKRKKKES